MPTINDLESRSRQVEKEVRFKMNTAFRIGRLFYDILQFIKNLIVGVSLDKSYPNEAAIKAIPDPKEGQTHRAEDTGNYWRFNGTEWVNIGDILPSDAVRKSDIVNDLTTGGVDKVLSAEQGKMLISKYIPVRFSIPGRIETDGSYINTGSFFCTDFIPIWGGVDIWFEGIPQHNTYGACFCYDKQKNPISPIVANPKDATGRLESIPEKAEYIRLSSFNNPNPEVTIYYADEFLSRHNIEYMSKQLGVFDKIDASRLKNLVATPLMENQLLPKTWSISENSSIDADNKVTFKKDSSGQTKFFTPSGITTAGDKYILFFNIYNFKFLRPEKVKLRFFNHSQALLDVTEDGLYYAIFTANAGTENLNIQCLIPEISGTPPNTPLVQFCIDWLICTPYNETLESNLKKWKQSYVPAPTLPIQALCVGGTKDIDEPPLFAWNALGDSITVGNWMKYVGLLDTSRTYVIRNFGVGGTTLAKVASRTDSMVERYMNMADNQTTSVTVVDKGVVIHGVYNNAEIASYLSKVQGRVDLITLAGGTNDVGYSYQLGEIGNKDITTIIGAVSTILEAWFKEYPLAKKLIILPPENDHPGRWGQIKVVEPIVKAIMQAANYYNIPFADSYYESGINKFTMTGAENFFNPDNATVGKKVDTGGGIVTDADYTISGSIPVGSMTTLTSNFGENTRFACFDSSDNLLGVVNWSSAIMWQEQNYPLATGTNYVIGSFKTTDKNRIWVGNYDGALMPDRVHPNTAGQKNIANIVWIAVKKIFG